ncbi:MAG: ThuA domain-containing protein [Verrucomicrobiales bacterium]
MIRRKFLILSLIAFVSAFSFSLTTQADEKLKLLLVDGQNNHAWQETSPVLKSIFEESGRFEVTVSTTPGSPPRAPRKPKNGDDAAMEKFNAELKAWMMKAEKIKAESKGKWDAWRPNFSDFDVVVSNYNGEPWPEEVQKSFEEYVNGGGGFVSVHAADNSFPKWKAYNEMIAVGGWGGRSELSGPYLRFRDGKWTKDMTVGKGGSHGKQHEFFVETQNDHPIVAGLPKKWKHAQDELYDRLRGPAKNVTVLASAFADPKLGGSGEMEPMIMVVDYGKGRCVHTTLGHSTVAMADRGFHETTKRSAEWAATGKVTFPEVPASEMAADSVSPAK